MIQMKYTIYIVSKVDIVTGRYCSDINRDGQINVTLSEGSFSSVLTALTHGTRNPHSECIYRSWSGCDKTVTA